MWLKQSLVGGWEFNDKREKAREIGGVHSEDMNSFLLRWNGGRPSYSFLSSFSPSKSAFTSGVLGALSPH